MLKTKYHIYDSAILDKHIDAVWKIVRDLVGLVPLVSIGKEMKLMECCWVEGGSAERVPSKYQLTYNDSQRSLLEVVGRSETEHFVTYQLVSEGLGLSGYTATCRLRPITTGNDQTFLEWTREFSVVSGLDAEATVRRLTSITQDEVLALKTHISKLSVSTST